MNVLLIKCLPSSSSSYFLEEVNGGGSGLSASFIYVPLKVYNPLCPSYFSFFSVCVVLLCKHDFFHHHVDLDQLFTVLKIEIVYLLI